MWGFSTSFDFFCTEGGGSKPTGQAFSPSERVHLRGSEQVGSAASSKRFAERRRYVPRPGSYCPDGTVKTSLRTIRKHRVLNSAGEVVRLVGTSILDITEHKRAEESLRQSEAYLAESQRLSYTGSWALDLATNRYIYTSEESDRMWGFDPRGEKPSRQAISERIHPEDRSSWKRNLEKSLRKGRHVRRVPDRAARRHRETPSHDPAPGAEQCR